MSSEVFLKIISENNNSEALDEEIDQVLNQLSKKMSEMINKYNRNTSWAKERGDEKVLRYYLKNLKSEFLAVSKFARELIESIK